MKYELLEQDGVSGLWRIKALRDIPEIYVMKGDLGGLVSGEHNLSQTGNAWVFDNARVYSNAKVYGKALVCGNARVYGNAQVHGDALVYGSARVYGDAQVFGDAWAHDHAQVYGRARVDGHAQVYGGAQVFDDAWVHGNAQVHGNAKVYGNAQILLPEHCITIAGLQYLITITPQNIVIGCQIKTREEWLAVTPKEAQVMGLDPEHFPFIRLLVDQLHQVPELRRC